MKGRTYLGVLIAALLFGGTWALYAVAQGLAMVEEQASPPIGIAQIDGSTVNYVSPDMLPTGVPLDLCFNVTVESPDQEYMDLLEIDLPDSWTITEVYTVPASGCGSGTLSGIDPGNLISWSTDAPLPSGCGAWLNGTYDFCANISLPDCSGAPWSLPWYIQGDYWGDPPHDVSGTTDPLGCLDGDLVVTPETLAVEGCHTLTQTHLLNLLNDTGDEGTFDLSYDVPSGNGSLSGPDNIYLGGGVDQDFIVELEPDECLPDGTVVTATIEVTGNSYNDSSTIVKTIRDAPECPVCEPPTLTLRPEYRESMVCAGVVQTAALTLTNDTGMGGTFDLAYDPTSDFQSVAGPGLITLTAGAEQVFEVELLPAACLSAGTRMTVTVSAFGNGASDSAVIVAVIADWPECPDLCPWEYYYLPIIVRDP